MVSSSLPLPLPPAHPPQHTHTHTLPTKQTPDPGPPANFHFSALAHSASVPSGPHKPPTSVSPPAPPHHSSLQELKC